MTEYQDQPTLLEIPTMPGRYETRVSGTADVASSTPDWLVTGTVGGPGMRVEEVQFPETTNGRTGISGLANQPTSDRADLNREMALLESAARAENALIFVTILKSIRWQMRPSEDYLQAIRLALAAGFHPSAWEMTEAGIKRFPENPELKKIWQLFSPARGKSPALPNRAASSAERTAATADTQWLKANRDHYQGKWVALKSGELLAVGANYQELIDQVGNPKGRGILITVVY